MSDSGQGAPGYTPLMCGKFPGVMGEMFFMPSVCQGRCGYFQEMRGKRSGARGGQQPMPGKGQGVFDHFPLVSGKCQECCGKYQEERYNQQGPLGIHQGVSGKQKKIANGHLPVSDTRLGAANR